MKKRVKWGICLGMVFCMWANTAVIAAAETDVQNEASDYMLNKYSPAQEVKYHSADLTVTDSRICSHGDRSALDILYTGTLEKKTWAEDSAESSTASKTLTFWACQSDVLGGSCQTETAMTEGVKAWKIEHLSNGVLSAHQADNALEILSAAGRESHNYYLQETGEALTTDFLDFTITNVRAEANLEGRAHQINGSQWVLADVQVKNIFHHPIPVGNYDFTFVWSDGSAAAQKTFREGMYPDRAQLPSGESLSGTLIFEIPQEVTDFKIVYQEIWDDHFPGSVYSVICTL